MVLDWCSWFYYDTTSPTGLRINKVRLGGKDFKSPIVNVGDVAGCVQNDGYGKVSLNGDSYYTHRIIWEMHFGKIPKGLFVDHKDGNRANYLLTNLRLVTTPINCRNKCMPSTNTSGVVGVRLFNSTSRGRFYSYWRAFWTDHITKKSCSEDFSISKYGSEVAFALACTARCAAIENMNKLGAGYFERHGEDALTKLEITT